jgi:hypothetical protein
VENILLPDSPILETLLAAGISASSADNCQPWLFEVDNNTIKLRIDSNEVGKFFDPGLAATLISCGGVCELIRIAASAHGLDTDIQYNSGEVSGGAIAELRFSATNDSPDPFAQCYLARGVHRGHYQRWKTVPNAVLNDASHAASVVEGTRVDWLEGTRRRKATNLIYKADAVRFSHPVVHQQFYQLLRFGDDIEHLNDGLAADTLGIERIFLPVLKAMRPWSRAAKLNKFGWNYVMAARGAWVPCVTSAGLGAIVQDRDLGYFEAGRALHRVWTAMNCAGLAFQPLGALPLFLMRMEDLNGEGFDDDQRRRLSSMANELPAIIDGFSPDKERLIMLFRYGYPFRAIARARRRPIEHFLRSATE